MIAGILLVASIVATAMAVVVLVQAIWPRRRGDTPHCRRCNYNLTGLTSDRCPECGATVAAGGVVYGERHRRREVVGLGGCLLVLTITQLVDSLSEVDWYGWAPTSLLMIQVQGASPGNAWFELDRRIRANGLSDGQHARLIDLALKEQGAAQASPVRREMLDYLGDCFTRSRLSKEQEKRFFDQIVVFDLTVRPTVVLGDPVPYEVCYQSRGPSPSRGGLWHEVRSGAEETLDGKSVRHQTYVGSSSSGTGGGSLSSSLQCKVAGRHALTVAADVVVYSGPAYEPSAGTVVSTRRVSLDGTFEVAASEPPGYIRRVKDTSMGSLLRAMAVFRNFKWRTVAGCQESTRRGLGGQIVLRAVPVNVAFEVIARIEGREYPLLGTVKARRGKGISLLVQSDKTLPVEPRPQVDIVLRSSERVARGTVDLFEIWEGELVFKNVPVEGVPATPPSSP